MKKEVNENGLYSSEYEHDSCGIGAIADVRGRADHRIVEDAESILLGLSHRGAQGSEANTGDGAGILTSLPHKFFRQAAQKQNHPLPEPGKYAAGLVFLPKEAKNRKKCKDLVQAAVARYGGVFLFWREVPVDNSGIGKTALEVEPAMEQLFAAAAPGEDQEEFERKLFLVRKKVSRDIRGSEIDPLSSFYICSLSSKTIVYKGMLTSGQLYQYFPDLRDPDYQSYMAMVHSRFSTNTFPAWHRAHPFRYLCHNGEINTIRGNVNYMRSREGLLKSDKFGNKIDDLLPLMEADTADSGNFDNALEFLHLAGRSLDESMLLLIPEAWQNNKDISDEKRSWYQYNSCLMEPWDGPSAIFFSNGDCLGASLDRNGLRPVRYYLTRDEKVIMSSEAGVLRLAPEEIAFKGRLQAGKIFLIDFLKQEIVDGDERKEFFAGKHPYGEWLKEQRLTWEDLPEGESPPALQEDLSVYARAFGCTDEHQRMILKPVCENGKEPLGSMGNDAALAVLSSLPRLHFDYFHQLFAQVTNPPIDSIRERSFMTIESHIGPQKNLLETSPEHCRRLYLPHPVLTNGECAKLRSLDRPGWKTQCLDITYPLDQGPAGLEEALDRLSLASETAILEGYSFLLLSDRAVSPRRISTGALLAAATIHHHLIRQAKRTQIGIVVETGEAREVHHFCCLFAYGADGVNPYLAYGLMEDMSRRGEISPDLDEKTREDRYRQAMDKGLCKVFGKMGISTLESYKSAQIFEAVGLSPEVIERSFTGTASRVGGIGYQGLAEEMRLWHALAFQTGGEETVNFGEYQWRQGQEVHMWDPLSVSLLQQSVQRNDGDIFKRFSQHINENLTGRAALRGALDFVPGESIPLEEVEPMENILRRFVTGAMSLGSLGKEAHETLAVAMNRVGGRSNTGEGGEDRARYQTMSNGDSRRSAIKQVASGRFGVNIEYLTNADEIQIKMAQGAKPGEGGELPGTKVFPYIAGIRFSSPGVELISPPPHHDIYSIEDLAQLIFDLKNANPQARISVKLVAEAGVGTIAAGVAKAHADHILISGFEGGTGASPLTGIKHAGLPWELGISETHQTLVMNDLRSRVVLQTDGQLKTGRDVVIAALLGAEEFGFGTGPLISLGCIMMRKCEKNVCPVGIATQDEKLRAKFQGKPEYVVNFLTFIAREVREIMAELGYRSFHELVGKTKHLKFNPKKLPSKSQGLSLKKLLHPPRLKNASTQVYACQEQDHGIENVLDRRFIAQARQLLEEGLRREQEGPQLQLEEGIQNTDRSIGAMFSHELCKRFGPRGLQEGDVQINLKGSAGQSFGAWLIQGVTLNLFGETNDYPGKGLSGGTLIIRPPRESTFPAEENIIVGNVAFYGAVSGRAFIRGQAAERFCVRNSGAHVVVEGLGDHGCEYMTGGRVLILGPVGRNFAAGMSGGTAYIRHPGKELESKINQDSVKIYPIEEDDEDILKAMLKDHYRHTESPAAAWLLSRGEKLKTEFVKITSPLYRRILENQKKENNAKELVYG